MAVEAEAGARRAAPTRRPVDLTTPSLLGLPLAWLAVFFVVPIAIVAAYSVDVSRSTRDRTRFTLDGVARLRAQLDLPPALLEVREDVADRLGDHRRCSPTRSRTTSRSRARSGSTSCCSC